MVWRGADGAEASAEFDTVLLAVGRDAFTHKLGFDKVGVDVNPKNGKLPCVNDETTSAPHVYAIGDVVDGEALDRPSALTELTPVAIQAGRLLASRLYGGGTRRMDYQMVPTTVFTPLEYGCVGLTEEAAIAAYGDANVEVYHQYFTPLEWRVVTSARRKAQEGYAKLIVHSADANRVVGLHITGPNAGEMVQGSAVAMRCGATKTTSTRPSAFIRRASRCSRRWTSRSGRAKARR